MPYLLCAEENMINEYVFKDVLRLFYGPVSCSKTANFFPNMAEDDLVLISFMHEGKLGFRLFSGLPANIYTELENWSLVLLRDKTEFNNSHDINTSINNFCENLLADSNTKSKKDYYIKNFTRTLPDNIEQNKYDKEFKRLVKQSLYEALVFITEKSFPWGSLTGIRPSYIAGELLLESKSVEKTKNTLIQAYGLSEEKADIAINIYTQEQKILERLAEGSIAIFVGIPLCPSRCSYCSFTPQDGIAPPEKFLHKYVHTLIAELKACKPYLANKKVAAVYIGGGTPAVIDEHDLVELISCLKSIGNWTDDCEFSFEAGRSDCLTPSKLSCLKDMGVNRICINPQTIHDATLKRINRRHDYAAVLEIYKEARKLGYDNINMDLIAGLPKEHYEDYVSSLKAILDLGPENISIHSLALKRSSKLRAKVYEKTRQLKFSSSFNTSLNLEEREYNKTSSMNKTDKLDRTSSMNETDNFDRTSSMNETDKLDRTSSMNETDNFDRTSSMNETDNFDRTSSMNETDNFDKTSSTLNISTKDHSTLQVRTTSPDEEVGAMLTYSKNILEANNYHSYYMYKNKEAIGGLENIAYTVKGKECIYNVMMIADYTDIWSFGAGAMSKKIDGSAVNRAANVKSPYLYVDKLEDMVERKINLFAPNED